MVGDHKSWFNNRSGLWITEFFFNDSCSTNCDWEVIDDQMLMYRSRSIQTEEELCISYFSHTLSFQEGVESLKNWIKKDIRFQCHYRRFSLMRSDPDCRMIDEVIERADRNATKLITIHDMKVEKAKEINITRETQERFLHAYQGFSLEIQHNSSAKLCAMIWLSVLSIQNIALRYGA